MGSRIHIPTVNPVGLENGSLARALQNLHFIIYDQNQIWRMFTSIIFMMCTNKSL